MAAASGDLRTLAREDDVGDPDVSDKTLVERCLRGDERAARDIVVRYERPVFSLIHRMVRDRELAEDLAQETFVRTLNNLKRYDPSYKFSSWLFKIGYNLTIDHLRKKELDVVSIQGAPDAVTPDAQAATRITLETREERPDELLEARELGSEIEVAIGELRPEYRTAILLRHVEGHSYEEIARIMDVPLGTVKTYIHRARNELKEALVHLMEP
ncbi:MAG: sigma-70 family RNA polymerase sigma factor [Gemmatimonadota bacterium]|nr:sigma-70 family RNA polymerase sigma factor [Gemmatimonadota bacterium]